MTVWLCVWLCSSLHNHVLEGASSKISNRFGSSGELASLPNDKTLAECGITECMLKLEIRMSSYMRYEGYLTVLEDPSSLPKTSRTTCTQQFFDCGTHHVREVLESSDTDTFSSIESEAYLVNPHTLYAKQKIDEDDPYNVDHKEVRTIPYSAPSLAPHHPLLRTIPYSAQVSEPLSASFDLSQPLFTSLILSHPLSSSLNHSLTHSPTGVMRRVE